MSLEALWTAEFETEAEGWKNVGVVVLDTGRVFGGDGGYYYTGRFELKDRTTVEAKIVARHYHGPQWTAFGTTEVKFVVTLIGVWNGKDEITGYMYRPDQPESKLQLRLQRRESLP